ncbi:[citrate (pro-3S)-lyase] ligase [Clostridium sp. AM58-1XD]|uniref:[citrate (pro-3S)-lyase] ligase n=1 Tax=Clostridium sp. AM58-1XD TaxID=2292307 RepID=UPI000E52A9B0|nr:[citrate (pro-3S)-lyase] ligase [Clostridium sp. AM58-1XD]RGY98101.1 [citrate (pro-3S)-lyase] ligase [Clostridium sp. AM58-1XD]
MAIYHISPIYPSDERSHRMIDQLLADEGIRRDENLDYTCGVFDDNMNIIATGSCFSNTLRCLAVSSAHQGEGLMNQVVTHLIEEQFSRGNSHLFLCTKCSSAKFFRDLGFYEIVEIENQIVFMENKKTGFSDYLSDLEKTKKGGKRVAALVMNANPFTTGHQYLAETASRENDIVHLFMVSEEASLIPFHVRKELILKGTSHLHNIIYHDSGPYMISNATFPSYFQRDEHAVIESHAMLDLTIFCRIAEALGITRRYVGEEPASVVTGIYNDIMKQKLPENGIECIIVPRKELNGAVISASTVRKAIQDHNFAYLKELVPLSTYEYFISSEAAPVIDRIKTCADVLHY